MGKDLCLRLNMADVNSAITTLLYMPAWTNDSKIMLLKGM